MCCGAASFVHSPPGPGTRTLAFSLSPSVHFLCLPLAVSVPFPAVSDGDIRCSVVMHAGSAKTAAAAAASTSDGSSAAAPMQIEEDTRDGYELKESKEAAGSGKEGKETKLSAAPVAIAAESWAQLIR